MPVLSSGSPPWEKKKATEAEAEARGAASAMTTQFKRTVRRVFKGNIPVLTEVGLYPSLWRTTRNGNDNGRRSGPSKSTAAVLDRRRMLFGKGQELAERGWSLEEITEGANLVEAHSLPGMTEVVSSQFQSCFSGKKILNHEGHEEKNFMPFMSFMVNFRLVLAWKRSGLGSEAALSGLGINSSVQYRPFTRSSLFARPTNDVRRRGGG